MGLAAIWLGLLHHWLGPKTKNLCIAAIWVPIITDPISYLGQNAKIPDATLYKSTTSQHFTDALTHNSRLDTALIIVTILGIVALLTLFLTPLIWKLAHWRKSI